MDLARKRCVPCEGGVKQFSKVEALTYLKDLNGWKIINSKLTKRLAFGGFMSLIKFVNELAALAESEGHHPDFCVHYSKLDVEIWTHAINGLSENDFILAAKIDKLYERIK